MKYIKTYENTIFTEYMIAISTENEPDDERGFGFIFEVIKRNKDRIWYKTIYKVNISTGKFENYLSKISSCDLKRNPHLIFYTTNNIDDLFEYVLILIAAKKYNL